MPEGNEQLRFGEPVTLLRAVGKLTDEDGNEFGVVATGGEDEVMAFLDTLPLSLRVGPVKPRQQANPAQDKDRAGEKKGPPESYEQRSDEEEVEPTLVVEVRRLLVSVEPPYNLHFEIDPPILEGVCHAYEFVDYEQADVICTSNLGNVDLYVDEKEDLPGNPSWVERCASTSTGPVDECICPREFTGEWRVRVRNVAAGTSNYSLTGDYTKT
jgi:hypothetical protein